MYIYDFKDQSPIRFEFFQSDMEKLMFWLDEAIRISPHEHMKNQMCKIKADLEHKIGMHKQRGEWK